MTAAGALGLLLIAAGPAVVIWCTLIASKSFLVLLALASSFYWLLTLLLTSLLFRAFVPLPEYKALYGLALAVSVVIQEVARYVLFLLQSKLNLALEKAAVLLEKPHLTAEDHRALSLTHGVGHALAQSVFLYFSWLQLSFGKGTLYLDVCPQMSYFLAAALLTTAFFFFHTFSMVVAFHSWESKSFQQAGLVSILHLLAALLTLLSLSSGGCAAAVSLELVLGSAMTIWAAAICWLQPASHQGQPAFPSPPSNIAASLTPC